MDEMQYLNAEMKLESHKKEAIKTQLLSNTNDTHDIYYH